MLGNQLHKCWRSSERKSSDRKNVGGMSDFKCNFYNTKLKSSNEQHRIIYLISCFSMTLLLKKIFFFFYKFSFTANLQQYLNFVIDFLVYRHLVLSIGACKWHFNKQSSLNVCSNYTIYDLNRELILKILCLSCVTRKIRPALNIRIMLNFLLFIFILNNLNIFISLLMW